MKNYNDWLVERVGVECEIYENITFPALASTIRAIISNIPAYLAEATEGVGAKGKYDGLPSQDCHALILRKLDVLRDSLTGRGPAPLYDVTLFESISAELVELAKRADEDWSKK